MVEIFHEIANKDTSTLAALTALNIGTAHIDLNEAFLMKTAMCSGFTKTPDLTDKVYLVLAYGDPTEAQVASGIANEADDPTDQDTYRTGQLQVRRIIDMIALDPGSVIGAERAFTWHPRIPKKGIPFTKGDGWAWLLWNPSSGAFTNGPTVHIFAKIIGAWMGRS